MSVPLGGPLRRCLQRLVVCLGAIAAALGLAGPAAGGAPEEGDPIAAFLSGELLLLDGSAFGARFSTLELATTGMEPNLRLGDAVLIDRAAYRAEPIVRGDIISHRLTRTQAAACGATASVTLVKRVIGLPGDRLEVPTGRPEVIVNGAPYVVDGAGPNRRTRVRTYRVPPGKLFVLGDNRPQSCDSGQWGFVSSAHVRGRVSAVYFPRARVARVLPGGAIQPVDVSASPSRPRFDYAIALGRATRDIGERAEALRRCATTPACGNDPELQRLQREAGFPVTTRRVFLLGLRVDLADAITTGLRSLRPMTRDLRTDCTGPSARRLLADLVRDRRLALSAAPTPARGRTIAVLTQRHLARALTRIVTCWS